MWNCKRCNIAHDHPKDSTSARTHSVTEIIEELGGDPSELPDDYLDTLAYEPNCHCGIHEFIRDFVWGVIELPSLSLTENDAMTSLFNYPLPKDTHEDIWSVPNPSDRPTEKPNNFSL